jgi:NAD-dependent dihydropyrimidine dehydrogenase PreA subunit
MNTKSAEIALPEIDARTCTRCGRCVATCPEDVLALTEEGLRFERPEACTYCGLCETLCPEQAVVLRYRIVWDDDAA